MTPTFERLCELEPRLLDLQRDIQAVDGSATSFCANEVWYGYTKPGFKARLVKLVGWEAEKRHPELVTCDAYMVAYDTLYDELPGCGACGCLRLEALGISR